jgi:hypothetical protein
MPMALVALTAASAVGQIMQGQAANQEARYNANLIEQRAQQKAQLLDKQAGIERYQYARARRELESKSYARMAKSGLMPSGSPMEVLVDSMTQLNIDEAIGQYNISVEKQFALADAKETASTYRRKGKQAVTNSYFGALTTVGKGAYLYGSR